ncbi:cuticle protein 8-like [Periplaneta americana]|uniref:cuticle protein 8-like n=1 Tax=Periplaneta americana TaxID=6978 RepID=UPI0037E9AB15
MDYRRIATVFAALVVTAFAAPGLESLGHYQQLPLAHGHLSFSHAPLQLHAPLPVAHAPLTFHHAPLKLEEAPVSFHHAPLELPKLSLQVHAAPLKISHVPLEVAHEPEKNAPANYEFKYGVKDDHTHDIKEQHEKRVGDKVEGYYSLVEPDGTTRTVKYTADKHNGFNAVVTKSGHSSHPESSHKKEIIPIKQIIPIKKIISAPLITYSHAPATHSSGEATSYSSYSSGHEYSYGHGLDLSSYGGHY